jgi:hypothetical protein
LNRQAGGGIKGSPLVSFVRSLILLGVSVFVLLPALVLSGCSVLTGEDWTNARNAEPAVFLDYNLQNYVPIPTTDDVPVVSVRRGDVVVSVAWKDDAGNPLPESFAAFEDGAEYQADITLTPNDNNGFFFDPEISFYYPPHSVKVPPDAGVKNTGVRRLSVSYNPTEAAIVMEDIDLSGVLTPEPGAPGVSYVTVNQEKIAVFSGLVTWKPADGYFVAGRSYIAAAMLYPGPGYVFGQNVRITHKENPDAHPSLASSPDLSVTYGGDAANSRAIVNRRKGSVILVTVDFGVCKVKIVEEEEEEEENEDGGVGVTINIKQPTDTHDD